MLSSEIFFTVGKYIITRKVAISAVNATRGHTIRCAIVENPIAYMLHTNFMAPCFIEPELLQIEVLHCGNRHFQPVLLL